MILNLVRFLQRYFGAVILCILCFLPPAHAQSKLALVIGNSAYGNLPALRNPANDAQLLTENLQKLGFKVSSFTDQSQAQMKAAIAGFTQSVSEAGPDSVAMIYYAGHGVQIDGTNYLIPVDANVNTAGDVVLGAVSATDLLKTLELARAKVNVLVLDACRNNPFKSNTRSFSRGLARVEAPPGSIVAYATAPGQVAADGDSNNSPYAEALSRNLATPGLALESIFRQVRIEVSNRTDGTQVPWEETSLTQEVILLKASSAQATQPEQAIQTPAIDSARAYMLAVGTNTIEAYYDFLKQHPQANESQQALRNIEMLADEKNWRDATQQNTLGAYKIYLNLHPQGTYATEAQNQIAVLATPAPKTAPPQNAGMVEAVGYDISGTDIKSVRDVSFQQCSTECFNNPQCAAAAYREDLRRCYLKSTASIIIKNKKVNMTVRAEVSNAVPISAFEMLPQSDIQGGDLFAKSSTTSTAQNCLKLCEVTNGCNAFSYVTTNKACWLKSGSGKITANPPVVSGIRQ